MCAIFPIFIQIKKLCVKRFKICGQFLAVMIFDVRYFSGVSEAYVSSNLLNQRVMMENGATGMSGHCALVLAEVE